MTSLSGKMILLLTMLPGSYLSHAQEMKYFVCKGPGGTKCSLDITTIEGSRRLYNQEYRVTYDFSSCSSASPLSGIKITGKELETFDLWYGRKDTQTVRGFELMIIDTDPDWTRSQILGTNCRLLISWTSTLSNEAKAEFATKIRTSIDTMQAARSSLADNAYYQGWSKRIESDPNSWASTLKAIVANLRAQGNSARADDLEDILLGDETLGRLQETEMKLVCLARKALSEGKQLQLDLVDSSYGESADLNAKVGELKTLIGSRACQIHPGEET